MFPESAGGEKAVRACRVIDRICSVFISVMTVLMLALVVVYATIEPVLVSGASMENSYYSGDTVLISKADSSPERGDIVVISHGDGNLIKRVVAVEGDRIGFVADDDGKISLYLDRGNGFERQDEPFVKEDMRLTPAASTVFREIEPQDSLDELNGTGGYTVSDGCFFALGDNRNISLDSRCYGEFRERDIVGRVITTVEPNGFLDAIIGVLYREPMTENN